MSLTRTQAEAAATAIDAMIRADHGTPANDEARAQLVEALMGVGVLPAQKVDPDEPPVPEPLTSRQAIGDPNA